MYTGNVCCHWWRDTLSSLHEGQSSPHSQTPPSFLSLESWAGPGNEARLVLITQGKVNNDHVKFPWQVTHSYISCTIIEWYIRIMSKTLWAVLKMKYSFTFALWLHTYKLLHLLCQLHGGTTILQCLWNTRTPHTPFVSFILSLLLTAFNPLSHFKSAFTLCLSPHV